MTDGPVLAELVLQGVAVIVGTADAARSPAVTRGWGPRLTDDGGVLTLCVDAPEGSPTLANLRAGGPVAVTLSRPTSYLSVQVKGPLRALGAADEDALGIAAAHVAAFIEETSSMGVPAPVIRATVGTELVAVSVEVAERYDQTPGPGAGRAL